MQVMPAFEITEKTLFFEGLSSPIEKFPYCKNILFRSLVVFATGFMATIIPKFGLFVNLTGAFACTALAFILPIIMYEKLNESRPWIKRFHYFLIIFGSTCGLISFIMSFIELVNAFKGGDKKLPLKSKNVTKNNTK